VMELVSGETLADRMKRGAISIEEALPIAKQIAEALEEAHDKGIVHRDLKPANIKVTPSICRRSRPAGNWWTSVPTCGRSERCCMRCSSARRLLTASQFQILWPFRFALIFSTKHFGQKPTSQ